MYSNETPGSPIEGDDTARTGVVKTPKADKTITKTRTQAKTLLHLRRDTAFASAGD